MNPYAPPPAHELGHAGPAVATTGPATTGPAASGGYAPPARPAVGYPPAPAPTAGHGAPTPPPPSPGPVLAAGALTATLLGLIGVLMAVNAVLTTRVVAGGRGAAAERLASPALEEQLLAGLPWLLQPACGIAFAVWLFLALRNARAWGTPIRHGPGWAFGAWLVPVLGLWRPKQLVDDVWRGSHPGAPPGTPLQLVSRPGLGYAWWGTWLLAPALVYAGTVSALVPLVEQAVRAAQAGAATAVTPTDPALPGAVPTGMDLVGLVETAAMWSLWGYVLWTVCALAAAALVVQVSLWQRERLRSACSTS